MRLIAVSIVKNEADIIEPFVRHTLAWVDQHLIFDHDSTDGTREILEALRREGLPVRLYTDEALGNLQQARSNHLSRIAARDLEADWVLPLDADEILSGPGRAALEEVLTAAPSDQPASLPLINYLPTTEDDATEPNPIRRLRYRRASSSHTFKVMIPRLLALDPAVETGKGSHVMLRDSVPLPSRPLPGVYYLAHFALRSQTHQILRVVLAELQRLSRGRAHHGLDVHYRLGYQLLAADPALFLSTLQQPVSALREQPVAYGGGTLRHTPASDWHRLARALLPYLEKLARSHGRLVDACEGASADNAAETAIREIPSGTAPEIPAGDGAPPFVGFAPLSGWCGQEGPVPDAFLPPFHWSLAPVTELRINDDVPINANLLADVLTYSVGQVLTIELNGRPVHEHTFGGINQLEQLCVPLSVAAGTNRLSLRYTQSLVSEHDPRPLAAIFLTLRILGRGAE